MLCPVCQKGTQVVDSRESKTLPRVVRKRECTACGYRFRTVEVSTASLGTWILRADGRFICSICGTKSDVAKRYCEACGVSMLNHGGSANE